MAIRRSSRLLVLAVSSRDVEAPWWAPTSGVTSLIISRDDRLLVALALQHSGEAGEVRVEPVLRGVALRRLAQVADHLVDVVLEVRDLAGRLDGDRSRQVALGHGRRDVRDRAELRRQRLGELVDVLGQPLPDARDALDLRLDAELALGADLAARRGSPRPRRCESWSTIVLIVSVELRRPRPSPRR